MVNTCLFSHFAISIISNVAEALVEKEFTKVKLAYKMAQQLVINIEDYFYVRYMRDIGVDYKDQGWRTGLRYRRNEGEHPGRDKKMLYDTSYGDVFIIGRIVKHTVLAKRVVFRGS
ncbi:hypothetical protein AOQ84DRAFT_203194 [Glonium stellatum]|uniref:Uncharacterized protein n=1 Tax=Glonium stellatum TaxID=574774 RepID=A0A8E2JVD6_9PEZI|nr:hypothetical protein AOQ84DRAFT_203194 [Glonium stellatum]